MNRSEEDDGDPHEQGYDSEGERVQDDAPAGQRRTLIQTKLDSCSSSSSAGSKEDEVHLLQNSLDSKQEQEPGRMGQGASNENDFDYGGVQPDDFLPSSGFPTTGGGNVFDSSKSISTSVAKQFSLENASPSEILFGGTRDSATMDNVGNRAEVVDDAVRMPPPSTNTNTSKSISTSTQSRERIRMGNMLESNYFEQGEMRQHSPEYSNPLSTLSPDLERKPMHTKPYQLNYRGDTPEASRLLPLDYQASQISTTGPSTRLLQPDQTIDVELHAIHSRPRNKFPLASFVDSRTGAQKALPLRGNRIPSAYSPVLMQKERAIAFWKNTKNIDQLLGRIYYYYREKGYSVILFNRIFSLLTFAFVAFLTLIMATCVDYNFLFHPPSDSHRHLSDVLDLGRLTHLPFFYACCLIIFIVYWLWRVVRFYREVKMLDGLYNFYTYLLEIPDCDMQSVEWRYVVKQINRVQREHRISADRLNAHDIANRIMRKENYIIALFNKNTLNIHMPPALKSIFGDTNWMLTRTLEWNISYCVLNYVFDENRNIRKSFLRAARRNVLAEGLRRRFIIMGGLNLLFAPFIFVFVSVYFMFRLGTELHKNPHHIGKRNYTRYARWLFREFNELPHHFEKRLQMSHCHAKAYMESIPSEKLAVAARFVSFVAATFAALIAIISFLNEDLLLHFELSPGRSMLWYLGLIGVVIAISRTAIPDEEVVFQPQQAMDKIARQTHYYPQHWRMKVHTNRVFSEFARLFQYRIFSFVQELLGVIVTPFVLLVSLPKSSCEIIDFFREFTVHTEGVGHVCSFAVFDFRKHGNAKYGTQNEVSDKHFQSRHGKMEKSFLSFKAAYPEWTPKDNVTLQFLKRAARAEKLLSSSSIPQTNPANPLQCSIFTQYSVSDNDEDAKDHMARKGKNPRSNGGNDRFPMDESVGPDVDIITILNTLYHDSE